METSNDSKTQPANSSINQSSQNFQSPPKSKAVQPTIPPVQATQPNFQQQPTSSTTESVTTSQTNVDGQTAGEKKSKLKYIAYFLLGLILSIAIWSIVTNRITIGEPTIKTIPTNSNQIVRQVEAEIMTDLSKLYPSRLTKVIYGENNPPLIIGETIISTFITVELSIDENIKPEKIVEIGNQVCSTFMKLQLSVSQVQIETVSTKITFSSSQGIGGTCKEYSSGAILNTLQSM